MVSTALEYILGAILGVSIGTLGGFAGIGGAPFFVAGLTLMLGYEQHLAQGTIVAVMLGPMSLPGCIVMWDRVKVLKWYICCGVCTYACFSYVGATISYMFNSDAMKFLFGILVLMLGTRNVVKSLIEACSSSTLPPKSDADADKKTSDDAVASPSAADKGAYTAATASDAADLGVEGTELQEIDLEDNADDLLKTTDGDEVKDASKPGEGEVRVDALGMNLDGITVEGNPKFQFSVLTSLFLGILVGTVGGLFGIGAGVLIVPMLTAIWGIHKDDARAMSLGILCPPVSLGAVIRYQAEGDIKWPMVGLQFACYVICNYFGAKAGKKVDTITFNRVLGGMLFVLGIILIVLSIQSCGGSCF